MCRLSKPVSPRRSVKASPCAGKGPPRRRWEVLASAHDGSLHCARRSLRSYVASAGSSPSPPQWEGGVEEEPLAAGGGARRGGRAALAARENLADLVQISSGLAQARVRRVLVVAQVCQRRLEGCAGGGVVGNGQ